MIGYAYVVADIFHIGHLRHLLNCKAMCDILIVGVLTDEATMEIKPRPIIPFEERIQVVVASPGLSHNGIPEHNMQVMRERGWLYE